MRGRDGGESINNPARVICFRFAGIDRAGKKEGERRGKEDFAVESRESKVFE